jgi:ribonuclease P protein component
MPPLARLTRRSEFLRTAAAQRKWVTTGVIVQARARQPGDAAPDGERETADTVRVGLTVSRKVGNAVRRNRARRRLRALAREILPRDGRPGTDYVLIGRRETPTRPAAELRADLETAVRKVNRQLDGGGRRRGKRGGRGSARTADAPPGDTETRS